MTDPKSNKTNPIDNSQMKSKHPFENKIPPPIIVLVIGAIMFGIAWFTPQIVTTPIVRIVSGGILIAVGFGVTAIGARTFWRAGTTIDPVRIDQASTLVTSGIFGYTRNPMYVGFTSMLTGWSICLGSPWTMLGPVVFVLFTTRFQIIPEERMMLEKFGDTYLEYKKRVRRWI